MGNPEIDAYDCCHEALMQRECYELNHNGQVGRYMKWNDAFEAVGDGLDRWAELARESEGES